MIAHAERTFALSRLEQGVSYRETLEGLLARAKTDEKRLELEVELTVPPLPPAMAYLWAAFLRLSSRRGSNGFGPSRLTHLEIETFQRVTGLRLRPWEVALIEALDDIALSAAGENRGH